MAYSKQEKLWLAWTLRLEDEVVLDVVVVVSLLVVVVELVVHGSS